VQVFTNKAGNAKAGSWTINLQQPSAPSGVSKPSSGRNITMSQISQFEEYQVSTLTTSLQLCCSERGPDSMDWEARSCEARILGFSSWARDISLRSISLAFVSEAKNCFLGASAFDQFHQPSSAKLAEIEIFLIASAFDQFHQPSSMKLKIGLFLLEHQPSISFLSFRQWIRNLGFSQSITLRSVSSAFINEAKYWDVSWSISLWSVSSTFVSKAGNWDFSHSLSLRSVSSTFD